MVSDIAFSLSMFLLYTYNMVTDAAVLNTRDSNDLIKDYLPENCKHLLHKDEKGQFPKYCTERPNIPAELLPQIQNRTGYYNLPDTWFLGYRDNSCDEEGEENCCTKSRWEQIYLVKLKETIRLVVQTEFVKQYIKVVICKNEGGACFDKLGLQDPFQKKTECITKTAREWIHVYDFNTKRIQKVNIEIPVACVCQISNRLSQNYDKYSQNDDFPFDNFDENEYNFNFINEQ